MELGSNQGYQVRKFDEYYITTDLTLRPTPVYKNSYKPSQSSMHSIVNVQTVSMNKPRAGDVI